MKTKEEIDKLAVNFANDAHGSPTAVFLEKGFKNGYTQCQEDLAELLRAEIHRAFMYGQRNGEMMEVGLERDEIEEYVNYRMLSINEQD